MTRSQDAVVEAQFGSQAAAYVASNVHSSGEDLAALAKICAELRPGRALDIGTGGGHVAYLLAQHARSVVAVDLSPGMLDVVAQTACERGLSNIETTKAPAERLPFEDASFDLVACRYSAHHWSDLDAGLREALRVLKPGCPAIFVDVISPAVPALDTHLQAVELLRDPSHVRNYSEAEWTAALARAGFRVRRAETRRIRMDYPSWVGRMRTSEAHQAAIRSLQQQASAQTATYFSIEADGSFSIDALQIEASACRTRQR
ncbi:class I SAM-dependent methyltransferase [Sphingomonas azotifigens]|uniref:class I SAM-dependent methyltransferase n=1 Tax=Sphingomonas azotifigens TaxID=330920 RepID=UPI000A0474A2|nr:methyltransferase domain-containing protein [Sphingomonas azotifigens]